MVKRVIVLIRQCHHRPLLPIRLHRRIALLNVRQLILANRIDRVVDASWTLMLRKKRVFRPILHLLLWLLLWTERRSQCHVFIRILIRLDRDHVHLKDQILDIRELICFWRLTFSASVFVCFLEND